MPTKKLRVSFDIDTEVLARALALGHHAMKIETYGEEPEEVEVLPKAGPPLALPAPKKKGTVAGIQRVIIDHLKTKPKAHIGEFAVLIVKHGYSKHSVANQVFDLHRKRLIKRAGGRGLYAITKKGANS
jgi:hypothetical protein